jgi:hypothetical protein
VLLALPPGERIERKKFQVFLANFLQGGSVYVCGATKPWPVPAPSYDGVAEIAESD